MQLTDGVTGSKEMIKVSNKSKGDATERQVKSILESKEWLVINSPRTMKRIFIKGRIIWVSQANDFFNNFDHCAKKNNKTLWIQTKFKNSGNASSAKKDITYFANEYTSEHEECQIWLKVPRKGFVIYKYDKISNEWKKEFITLKGDECEQFRITEPNKTV